MADIIYKINNGSDYHLASSAYCTCTTAASTAAKAANLQGSSSNTFNGGTIPTGITIYVKFTYSNTASNPTLNVNNSGAKYIKRYGTTAVGTSVSTSWRAGAIVAFTYDGTNWVMNTGIDDNSDSDTKNTAGATQQAGTLYVIGATEQTANPQTYSSSAVRLYNGCLMTENIDIYDELWFQDGGHIYTDDDGLHLSSATGNTQINGDLYVNTSIESQDGTIATKQWLQNYLGGISTYSRSAEINATIGFQKEDSTIIDWKFYEIMSSGESYNPTIEITPHTPNSSNVRYFIYVNSDVTPTFSCNGQVSVTSWYGNGYYRVNFWYDDGNLSNENCNIVVTCGSISCTFTLKFDRDNYVN